MDEQPKPALNPSQAEPPREGLVPLEAVLCGEELKRRPSRPPDYETESRAQAALIQAMADSPRSDPSIMGPTTFQISAQLSLPDMPKEIGCFAPQMGRKPSL